MNKNPLISIITPVFNREELIIECIKSVQTQTYKNYEHIIMDDGSSDKSFEVAQKFAEEDKRIKVFRMDEPSKGKVGKTRNEAIKKASGEILAFLDSDDLWKPEKLEKQVEFMLKGDYDLTYHPLAGFKENINQIIGYWGEGFSGSDSFTDLFKKNIVPPGSVLVKSEVVTKNNGFNEKLKISEDYFLWLLMALKKYKIGFLNDNLGFLRRNKHGHIVQDLDFLEKINSTILLRKYFLSDFKNESLFRLNKKDIFYYYIALYFKKLENEKDSEKRKLVFFEALEEIFRLNLPSFFLEELNLLKKLRK